MHLTVIVLELFPVDSTLLHRKLRACSTQTSQTVISKHQRESLQCSSQVTVVLCTWYGAQLDIYLQAKAINKSDSRFKYLKEDGLCTVENQIKDIRTNMYNVVKRDAQSETPERDLWFVQRTPRWHVGHVNQAVMFVFFYSQKRVLWKVTGTAAADHSYVNVHSILVEYCFFRPKLNIPIFMLIFAELRNVISIEHCARPVLFLFLFG